MNGPVRRSSGHQAMDYSHAIEMTDAREALAELDTDIETLPRADGDPFLEELRAHLAAKRILLHERIAGLAST